jgi:hypothetical protein
MGSSANGGGSATKNALALSAAAIALLITSLGSPAVAQLSDTLAVEGGGLGILLETDEFPLTGNVLRTLGVSIIESGQDITGSQTMLLTEPGRPNEISDIITATITGSLPDGFFLDVTMTSDGDVPLTFATTGPSRVRWAATWLFNPSPVST